MFPDNDPMELLFLEDDIRRAHNMPPIGDYNYHPTFAKAVVYTMIALKIIFIIGVMIAVFTHL